MSAVRGFLRRQRSRPTTTSLLHFTPPTPPLATSPQTLRGVPAPINQFYFLTRPGHPATISQNQWFRLTFFPKDHVASLFRKSSPAIRVRYLYGTAVFNDPTVDPQLKGRFNKSVDALDYSHVRVSLRRLYRELFWQGFQELEGVDGLYVFDVGVVPRGDGQVEEVKNLIKKAVSKTKTLDWTKQTEAANSRVDWRRLAAVLETCDMEVPAGMVSNGATKKPKKPSKS